MHPDKKNNNTLHSEEKHKVIKKIINDSIKQKMALDHQEAIASGMRVYNKGDKILNRYEVHFIKQGGMGKVYLCFDHEFKEPVAIKTILPKYFKDQQAKENFKNEALNWINLERHYNIVKAQFVDEIDHLPAIFAEMIAGDELYGNNLAEYLNNNYQFKTEEVLRLAVQLCDGMIYANQKFHDMGKIFVHRDIKPANIMMTKNRVLKITDFGLVKSDTQEKRYGGTYGYMSIEQFKGEDIDIRSDIYSFGCVLYEIITNGRKPYELTEEELESVNPAVLGNVLQLKHVNEKPVDPAIYIEKTFIKYEISNIIMKCLKKNRDKRYKNFKELREALEKLYIKLTGMKIPVIKGEELDEVAWTSKGGALVYLGKAEEAIDCCNNALNINPNDAGAWNNKGTALSKLGRNEEAINCYDRALKINPNEASSWYNKGNASDIIGRHEQAIECYDIALKINPDKEEVWNNKGISLSELGNIKEAIECYDMALKINPDESSSWYNKGNGLKKLGINEQAIECYDMALKINPNDEKAWYNKGNALGKMGRIVEAIECFNRVLKINPNYSLAWISKGYSLYKLSRYEEAIECYDNALMINPDNVDVLNNKGIILYNSGKQKEAFECFKKSANLGNLEAINNLKQLGLL